MMGAVGTPLSIDIALAVSKLGGVELSVEGEFRLPRPSGDVYVIGRPSPEPNEQLIDLATRIVARPAGGPGYRSDSRQRFASPPSCGFSRAEFPDESIAAQHEQLKTAHAEFDRATHLEFEGAEAAESLAAMLESEVTRARIASLIDGGASVRIDPGPKAWLTARYVDADGLDDSDVLARRADELLELLAELPAFETSGTLRERPGRGCLALLASGIVLGFVAMLGTNGEIGSVDSELEIGAAVLGLFASPVVMWLAWRRVRGRRKAERGTAKFLVGLGALIVTPLVCLVGARVVNAVGVTSEFAVRGVVMNRGVTRNTKKADCFWIELSTQSGNEAHCVYEDQYERAVRSTKVDVVYGQGRLGSIWLKRIVVHAP